MVKKCEHYWHYDYEVYQGPKGHEDEAVTNHRQCGKCGIHQMAVTRSWRKPFDGYSLPDIVAEDRGEE